MSTLTTEQIEAIRERIARQDNIPIGLGTKEEACSIAAINLALTGELTDNIPKCMSPVVGLWIIRIQDTMPDNIRNSARWRALLPRAAGTGREHEPERLSLIFDWMWGVALPLVQPVADAEGYGEAWRTMCSEKTTSAADASAVAASADYAAYAAASADYAASAAAASVAAVSPAYAASAAASAAAYAAFASDAWKRIDPCGLLERLCVISEEVQA